MGVGVSYDVGFLFLNIMRDGLGERKLGLSMLDESIFPISRSETLIDQSMMKYENMGQGLTKNKSTSISPAVYSRLLVISPMQSSNYYHYSPYSLC